jgi:hypothetical protein
MRHRLSGLAVMRKPPDEADASGNAIAFATAYDRASRNGGAQIVDP